MSLEILEFIDSEILTSVFGQEWYYHTIIIGTEAEGRQAISESVKVILAAVMISWAELGLKM